MSTFSRTATLFSTVALGSMLTATTVSSVDTVIHAAETTQTAAQKQSYKLQILQGDKDTPSTASQFYLDTISLEKLANGDYYAYLTSNTPANLGDEPIASTDTQHQVVKMGTKQNNGYNQTVYRMTLSANELASGQPIKTNIHVNIPMMNYDHNYTIRLNIQGFKPEPVASSQSTSSASTTNSSAVAPSSSVANSATTESNVANGVSQSTKNNPSSTTDTSKSTVAKTDSSQNDSQQATSDTAASTVNNSQTTKSTVDAKADDQIPAGKEVKMTADQGMDRFLKPSAYINIKGDLTDVTLSLNSDKVISMIPYMIFDGQKKDVTSQNITFTIPTKDLVADKDGNVTLASTTHVDAAGHVMDYPSNLTFNISQLMPAQKTFKTGDYQIAVSPDSQMDRFFAPKFNVKVGDVTSTVTVTYQNPNMMAMIPNVTFDGQTKDLNGKTTVDFTIPTKDLTPNKDGKVTIASFTSVPMSPHKGYASNITLDMNPALTNPSNDQTDSSASSSSETPVKPDKDILQDGTYSINYNVYKSGTTDASTMATYMTESAKVTVKKGEATVDFATKNDAMSMMKEFSINGVKAQAKGDSWIVKLPVKDLTKTANAQMTIFVAAINFTETPSADIVFDMKSLKALDNDGGASSSSSATSSSKPSQSSSSAASSSKPSSSSSSASSSSKPENKPEQKLTTDFKDGTYNVNYHIYKSGTTNNSTMSQYMTTSAKVVIKDGKATISFATKNKAMSMMKRFSVNGVNAKAKGDKWIVTVPSKNLEKTLTAHMHIEVPQIGLTEDPDADIKFEIAKGSHSASSSSSSSAGSSSAGSSSASSAINTGTKPINDNKKLSLKNNGIYSINYRVYKTGTHAKSTMQQYMTASANILVKDGKATIKFATKNGAMSLMKAFSINGVTAHKNGNAWQVTLPVSSLRQTIKAHMTIFVPSINFTEHPDADIVFDLSSLKNSNAKTTDFTKTKTDNTTPSGVNGAVALPTGHQNAIRNAVLHQLTILHGNNNSTSVAAQYFLPTIQLVHNANGSYTGYITTHTPVMMGRNPISFMDGNHQVQLVNTIKTGSYYQSTYRLSLSENEIKAPIATSIHVKFTAPLNYDHIYTIRLVIGRILNDASEATQPTTGLPDSSNLTTSPLSSDVSHGTFTTDFNSNAITGTSFTPLNTTNDDSQNNEKKANTIKPHTKKNSNATQVNKDAQADSKSNNTTQRNVLIVAGGILAAALGYIGVALLTNFFKMR
jgi:heme-binding NEAT domain protein